MKQVFAVCEQLGIGKLSDFSHIPYGLVSILDEDGKKKKMSSRGGETIYIDDLLNAVKTSLLDNNERGYSNQEAEKIAVAAIKFALLSLGRMTDTAISIEKILNQNGDTGVYVLYTRARLLSLLSKSIEENPQTVEELANPSFSRPPQTVTTVAAGDGASPRNDGSDPYSVRENDGLQVPPRTEALTSNEKLDFSAEEKNLIALLTYLPEIIKTSLEDLTTNRLADFLLDLSHAFNHLYATERFITEDQAETAKKLLLTRAALQAFNSALKILSITPVEKI
jgi:arginyl-tRNA synthetase